MNQNTFLQQAKAEKRSYLLYFFIYCPLGAVSPLIGQYLSSIGFSGTQVGIVTSTGTAVAVIAGLVWGKIYANTLQKRRLIALLFVCAATFAILTLRTTDFLLYVVLYGAMYAFQGPVHGLCDSFVMDSGKNFPVVRSFGALGYSAAVYLAGSYAEGHGLASIFYIYAITFAIAALVILRETEPPHYPEDRRQRKNFSRRIAAQPQISEAFDLFVLCIRLCRGKQHLFRLSLSGRRRQSGRDRPGVPADGRQ